MFFWLLSVPYITELFVAERLDATLNIFHIEPLFLYLISMENDFIVITVNLSNNNTPKSSI